MEARLNALLRLAINHQATDIHFTNWRGQVTIEMRIRDVIREVKTAPGGNKIVRYLQYLANLDVGNLLKPQTGQFEWYLDDRMLSLRFALIHNLHLENGVLRILDQQETITKTNLDFLNEKGRFFKDILNYRNGLYINSGPTGSGKTTTLYTLLHGVAKRKIFTIEDPVEIISESFIQIGINEAMGLGYDEAIKQVLRHDPDIIMIGEIRDELTAQMAIRAANTGHTVITSLHAGSCTLAIERMLELKVERGQLQNVLIGLSNQRLFPRLGSKEKIVIYETMDRRAIEEYFRTGEVPENHYSLKERIEDAQRQGLIAAEVLQEWA